MRIWLGESTVKIKSESKVKTDMFEFPSKGDDSRINKMEVCSAS